VYSTESDERINMRAITLGLILLVIGTVGGIAGYILVFLGSPEYFKLAFAGNAVQVIGFLIGMLK